MLAAKKSAGVIPQVNLRDLLHTGKWSMQVSVFETQGRHHQKFKTVVSVAPLMSSKNLKEKIKKRQKLHRIDAAETSNVIDNDDNRER